jgi:hypothetical protein
MADSSRRRREYARDAYADRSETTSDYTEPRRQEVGTPPWQTGLEQAIERNRTSLLSSSREKRRREDTAVINRINYQLRQAEDLLAKFQNQGWLYRHINAGAVYEQVLSANQVVSEDLLLVEDEELVRARIPDIRAGLKKYLGADDPRFDSYTRIIDSLSGSPARVYGSSGPFWRLLERLLSRRESSSEGAES